MSTNALSNEALIFNVCEKSPKNTEVIGTKTGAVPWPMTSVFPGELKNTQSLLDCIALFLAPTHCATLVRIPLAPAPAPMPTLLGETLDV